MDSSADRLAARRMMYDYLAQAPLLLPLAAPVPDGGPVVELPASPENLGNLAVSVDAASGHTAMIALLDADSLARRFPGCRFVRQEAAAVLRLFLGSRFDSLFVNPAGEWLTLSRDEARALLDCASKA